MDTAKIFSTGRSQAARLPKEFWFQTDEVCIKRIGSSVVLFDPRDRMRMLLGKTSGSKSGGHFQVNSMPPAT